MKDMIGRAVRLMVDVPQNMLGAICDLLEKMSGENGQLWFKELKRFLLKKPCWTGIVESVSEFLSLLSGDGTLTLDALDGKEILAEASEIFAYIDSDFKNWGADEQGGATEETVVDVYELVKDGTFAQFFGSVCNDVSRLCLTQAQIKNFVVKHRDWLRTDGYATLFLFRSHGNLFVAAVYFRDDGALAVFVRRFGRDRVWRAGRRHRVVLPELA